MDIIEVIFTSGTESKTGLLVISGNYGQVTEQFDLFNGKSIIPIPELEPGFYTIELSIDKNVSQAIFLSNDIECRTKKGETNR